MNRTVYTSHSKHNYYAKQIISAFVLRQDCVPLNPFMKWGYFLDDLVFEQELPNEIDIKKFKQKLKGYQSLKMINNIG